jgi:hypothetical protein
VEVAQQNQCAVLRIERALENIERSDHFRGLARMRTPRHHASKSGFEPVPFSERSESVVPGDTKEPRLATFRCE